MLLEDGLPASGFIRLKDVLAPNGPIPVSKSSWYEGMKEGKYPKPVPVSEKIKAYPVEKIRALIKRIEESAPDDKAA